jgi:hypothetical protein
MRQRLCLFFSSLQIMLSEAREGEAPQKHMHSCAYAYNWLIVFVLAYVRSYGAQSWLEPL